MCRRPVHRIKKIGVTLSRRKGKSGAKGSTTPTADRMIQRMVARDPMATVSQHTQAFVSGGLTISIRTVHRRIKEKGLKVSFRRENCD